MPTIGTAVLQIIPSLDGVSDAVDKQLGGKLFASGKRGGKQLAKGVGDGLKDLEKDVDSAAKAYSRMQDKASDALGKVRSDEAALKKLRDSGASDDRIIRAEERLAKSRRDSGRATREAEEGHRALQSAQSASTAGAAAAGSAMGRLSTVASGAGAALASAGAVAGGAALAGIAALGAGVVVAGNRLYELGAQFDDLSDNLQIKTGLSGAALEELKGHIEKLGTTNVPSTFGEIGDVAAEVTRSLHLTGPAFDDVTSRLANLQRMGVDVDIRTLGKAFRGFGVDAKDQAGALNSLYEASTKSGLSIDDMTAAVVKGGPALRQLGLDFGESAGLIASFEEAGLDGEKGMAALNKAFAYFSKEGIPAKQGLQDIISRIKELGATPAAGELANKVFGAKGGAAFLEAIQNGTLDLEALRSSLQTTGVDINAVSDDTADWSERWQTLKNKIGVALEPLGTTVFDTINEQLGNLATWVENHQDQVVDFFVAIGQGAITGVDIALDAVGQLAQGIGQLLEPFGDIQGAMLDFQAFQAEVRGDDETAKELRAQAQEAYGWGEGLDAAGAAMRNFDPSKLRDKLKDIGDSAKTSSDNVTGIGDALHRLPANVDTKVNITDGTGKPIPFDWFTGSGPGAPDAAPGGPTDPLTAPLGGGPRPALGPPVGLRNSSTPLGVGNSLLAQPSGSSGTYGLPNGTDIRQGAKGFPDWVYQVADAFGLQASTYAGHQEDKGQGNQGIDWWGPVENRQRFAEFLAANAANIPGLEDVIFENPNTKQDIGVNNGRLVGTPGSADPGYFRRGKNDFLDHTDHVHTTQSAPIPLPGGSVGMAPSSGGLAGSLYQDSSGRWHSRLPEWDKLIQRESTGINQRQGIVDSNSGGNEAEGLFQITPATWKQYGGTKYAPSAMGATPQEQAEIAAAIFAANQGDDWGVGLSGREDPQKLSAELASRTSSSSGFDASSSGVDLDKLHASPNLNNAFGPDYEPGIGTPGYDEYGKPGYYEADPKAVRDAKQRIEDQGERIREADVAAQQAQAAIDNLEVDADQAEKDAAIERKKKADYDAATARRELKDLQDDLGETEKGTFSPAKEASKDKKGGSGSTSLNLGSSLSGIGSAIGEFAGGQLGSVLDVFGVPDSPGWLQGISQFIGGIKIGGGDGASLPLTANPLGGLGAPPPDDAGNMHGGRAGQQPGPVYNITARDTEDAFIKAQRLEREKAAAKLSRF